MIEIVPYDPRWPTEFLKIARTLRESLGELALRIDHIGSTAVPGLAAKDRIDIQVTIERLDYIGSVEAALAPLGYSRVVSITTDHVPPQVPAPPAMEAVDSPSASLEDWQKFFFRGPPSQRPTNLHVRAQGKPNQRYALLFRDYLRARPLAAEAYARAKRALAVHAAQMTEAEAGEFYCDVKDPICDVIYAAAEDWARAVAWRTGPTDC